MKGVSNSPEENIPYSQSVPWNTRWLGFSHFNFEVKFADTPVSGSCGTARASSLLLQKLAWAPESGVGVSFLLMCGRFSRC